VKQWVSAYSAQPSVALPFLDDEAWGRLRDNTVSAHLSYFVSMPYLLIHGISANSQIRMLFFQIKQGQTELLVKILLWRLNAREDLNKPLTNCSRLLSRLSGDKRKILMTKNGLVMRLTFVVFGVVLMMPTKALAHCDGADGPVVKAAQQALAKGDVNLVLVWVKANDEAEIRSAFAKTMAVRPLNPEAKELADQYFFETLVRIHRAGEGAPYTGLKPAGRDLGPIIPAADKAIESGSVDDLAILIAHESANGIRERFQKVIAAKKFNTEDINAGRAYVKAYVEFLHYAEELHESVQGGSDERSEETDKHHGR
jgi:hypothetical protein